ncbi:hypothetical protein Y694_03932 [Methylibium sp. T29-B]|nr:hypothetical protein Y694_03932 [Methylibium sp. T29-B]
MAGEAAALADRGQPLAHVGRHRVAHFVGGGADVEAETATARHDVDRAVGHLQHADGADQVRRRSGALLDVERQLGDRGGGIPPAVHRRGAGVAGDADHLAEVAHAAVDGAHHAQRQVQLGEHRALLDVDLDEAEVARRIARLGRDRLQRGRQAGGQHRGAHRHAVGVLLVQPGGLEVAGKRAGAEEGGLVALTLLFGEADHLEAEGQAPAGAVQLAHAGHRHQDAEPAVVLATVAHGVVVAAGEQAPRRRIAAEVEAHHVADRIEAHLVEAAVAHPGLQLRGAGTVRVGQVGDGELAAFAIARVGVHGQLLGPVPHRVAQDRRGAELVVQADLGDAVDVAQALGQLDLGVALQPALQRREDLAPVQALAAWAAHRQHEGPAEARAVFGVEPLHQRELLRGAVVQAGARLLAGRFGGQRAGHRGLARQLGVGAHQRELGLAPGLAHHAHHRMLELRQAGERPLAQCRLGNPRRVLVEPVERGQRRLGRRIVEPGERQRGGGGGRHVEAFAQGWVACQCRAMSMRRHTQTRSCASMWSRKRCSAPMRPGLPSRRQCMPIDIILGASSPSA